MPGRPFNPYDVGVAGLILSLRPSGRLEFMLFLLNSRSALCFLPSRLSQKRNQKGICWLLHEKPDIRILDVHDHGVRAQTHQILGQIAGSHGNVGPWGNSRTVGCASASRRIGSALPRRFTLGAGYAGLAASAAHATHSLSALPAGAAVSVRASVRPKSSCTQEERQAAEYSRNN